MQLQYNYTNSSEKRNITDFGIISYKYRSLNCNEKSGRKENQEGRTYGSRWKIIGNTVILPTLAHDFGTSDSVITWIINGYQLAIVAR